MTRRPNRDRADRIDEAARASARDGLSRRQALRMLLGGSTAAVVGYSVVGAVRRSAPPADVSLAAGSGTGTAAGGAPAAAASGAGPAGIAGTGADASTTSTTALVGRAAANNCPFPNTIRPVTGPDDCPNNRIPKINHTPATNGCGPQAGVDFVPDDFGDYSFTQPCNGHDTCYGTCLSLIHI